MHAILESRDSIVVLLTGGGKSLCFQAAIVDPRGSPWWCRSSLMKDQVDGLRDGVAASHLNSTLPPQNATRCWPACATAGAGSCMSPERLPAKAARRCGGCLGAQLRFIASTRRTASASGVTIGRTGSSGAFATFLASVPRVHRDGDRARPARHPYRAAVAGRAGAGRLDRPNSSTG
jgi:hypothetical protein